MPGAYVNSPVLASESIYAPSAPDWGACVPSSLLCKILISAILLLPRSKLPCKKVPSMARVIDETEERDSGRNLFLRLLFALEEIQHLWNKVLPRSMYVPSRASRGDSNSARLRI